MNNLFSLKNQTILVTGSLGLIGKEITKSLYDFGANLILTDIHDEDFYNKNHEQTLIKYYKRLRMLIMQTKIII